MVRILIVVDTLPAELLAVILYSVSGVPTVGFPLKIQLVFSRLNPAGKEGVAAHSVMLPPIVGIAGEIVVP